MTDKDGVREFSPETLHINPLTNTPYQSINQFTYDYLAPEIQKLYRKDASSMCYGYFGELVEEEAKDD